MFSHDTIIDNLIQLGCDVTSIQLTARFANSYNNDTYNKKYKYKKEQYESLIKKIFDIDYVGEHIKDSEVVLRYMIYEYVFNHINNIQTNNILDVAISKKDKMFKESPWILATKR